MTPFFLATGDLAKTIPCLVDSSPAIIAHGIKILYYKDILEIIYLLKDNDLDNIMKVLEYYFPEGIDFKKDEIQKLKKSAINA